MWARKYREQYETEGEFDYHFEDLTIDDTDNMYEGHAEIRWKWDEDDPDVGYRGGFEFEIWTITVKIPITHEWQVDDKHPLYKAIYDAIMKDSDSMQDVIARKARKDW